MCSVIAGILEMRGGLKDTVRSEKMKRTSIKASKPILIIGAGSSLSKNISDMKNFPGTVIGVDASFNYLAEHGVVPDYVVTLEASKGAITENMFRGENLKRVKHKSKIICSSVTRDKVIQWFKKNGIELERYIHPDEPRCSNVGLLAVNYAYEILKADKIFLIGFEHVGRKYPAYIYKIWQVDFWSFIKTWPKETIVNCSDGGALYYEDYILDSTVDSLVV